MRIRRLATLPLLAGILVGATATPSAAIDPTGGIASIGDSITRATNAYGWYGDHPSFSWSTGFNPVDGFQSHYERLLRADHTIWGDELNVAESGARMADAPAQAAEVVRSGADYVTFLMGANDLCAPSPERMTPVPSFAESFEEAMSRLASGVPDARVLVASIPDLQRLAAVYAGESSARLVWRVGEICPTVLDPEVTPLDRLQVSLREHAYNLVLASVCARYPSCRFDGFAVNRFAFGRDDVSRLDFFHPSLEGQRALAALTWSSAGWST